jgi:hypothetical protein
MILGTGHALPPGLSKDDDVELRSGRAARLIETHHTLPCVPVDINIHNAGMHCLPDLSHCASFGVEADVYRQKKRLPTSTLQR